MNSILVFVRSDTAFDPEILASMGRAFDLVCAVFPGKNTSIHREEIATHIINLAKRGIRDSQQLYEGALKLAGHLPMSAGTAGSCRATQATPEHGQAPRDRGGGSS